MTSSSTADLERDAIGAYEKLQELRRLMESESDPARKRVLILKVEAQAQEHARCLQAFFATPRTL